MQFSMVRAIFAAAAITLAAAHSSFAGGNAIYFQNLDFMTHGDFVYCGAPSYGFTNKVTVTAWIKWTTDPLSFAVTPANHEREGQYSTYIAYASHNSDNNGQFWLRNSKVANRFQFGVQNTSNDLAVVSSTFAPEADAWYFLAGVYDGATVKLYVNGVLQGSTPLTGNVRTNDGTHRLNMGRLPWGYGFFVGYMDDVRIWTSALSLAEVQEQMTSAATVAPGTLASYWNFDEGTGIAINDAGAQNADGVFYTCLIDIHNKTTSPYTISDDDKTWAVNAWQNCPIVTVAGAGTGETNTVASNTSVICTLSEAWVTPPIADGVADMTWYGVAKSGETSQWVVSTSPLPVELIGFQGKVGRKSVVLTWKTATETDNHGFSVERRSILKRADAAVQPAWSAIAFVPGNGTSNAPHTYGYEDHSAAAGTYSYRLKQLDRSGAFAYSAEIAVSMERIPTAAALHQNFPNPFNPATQISYSLPAHVRVRLVLVDMLGRHIAVLVDEPKDAGEHTVQFNAADLPSGIYFYRMEAGTFKSTRRLVLIK